MSQAGFWFSPNVVRRLFVPKKIAPDTLNPQQYLSCSHMASTRKGDKFLGHKAKPNDIRFQIT